MRVEPPSRHSLGCLTVGLAALVLSCQPGRGASQPPLDSASGSIPIDELVGSSLGYGQGPVGEIGINKIELVMSLLNHGAASDGSKAYGRLLAQTTDKSLADARHAGATFVRFAIGGYGAQDVGVWLEDPERYWAATDHALAMIEGHGMRAVPVLLWWELQFPTLTGETLRDLVTDRSSQSFRLASRFVDEVTTRYRDDDTIAFWELFNELNLLADIGQGISTDEMIPYASSLAAVVRARDPDTKISSGYSMPRPSAEHLRRRGSWQWDSRTELETNLRDLHRDLDIVSVHFYNNGDHERFGVRGKHDPGLLNVVQDITRRMGKLLFVGEFGDVDPMVSEVPSGPFTRAVLDRAVALSVAYSAPWGWEFYQTRPDRPDTFSLEPGANDEIIAAMRAASVALGNALPVAPEPDDVPPRVILTWPIDGRVLGDTARVYAVASDGHLGVARVDLAIDDAWADASTAWPHSFELDVMGLANGRHTLHVIATDRAGNRASSEVVVFGGAGDAVGEIGATVTEDGTRISWWSVGADHAQVWVQAGNSEPSLFAVSRVGEAWPPWIGRGQIYRFSLYAADGGQLEQRGALLDVEVVDRRSCSATEEPARCDNALDDDCDGAIDCRDDDCSGVPCDDGDACSSGDVCSEGRCIGRIAEPVWWTYANPATVTLAGVEMEGVCVAAAFYCCDPLADAVPCEDRPPPMAPVGYAAVASDPAGCDYRGCPEGGPCQQNYCRSCAGDCTRACWWGP